MANTTRTQLESSTGQGNDRKRRKAIRFSGYCWWATEPRLGRVAHGVANRVDRLKAIGNGQVPEVVRTAWEVLANELE